MAWLAPPHRRCPPDAGQGRAAPLVEAASCQPHWHARRASADRLHAGTRAPPEGDRRLQGLDAGSLSFRLVSWLSEKTFGYEGLAPMERSTGRAGRPFPAVFPVLTALSGCGIRIACGRHPLCTPSQVPLGSLMMGRRASVATIAAALALGSVIPAAAQFGWIFGDPPRPPSSVPGGRP